MKRRPPAPSTESPLIRSCLILKEQKDTSGLVRAQHSLCVFLQRVRCRTSPAPCTSGRCPTASSCPGRRPSAPTSWFEATSSATAWAAPTPTPCAWTASRDTSPSRAWVRTTNVHEKAKRVDHQLVSRSA